MYKFLNFHILLEIFLKFIEECVWLEAQQEKQQQQQQQNNKQIHFKQEQKTTTNRRIGLTFKKIKERNKLYPYRSKPVRPPIPLKIIYTNNYYAVFKITDCLCNHKFTILAYMIINGKGVITGCGRHGYSFSSVHF